MKKVLLVLFVLFVSNTMLFAQSAPIADQSSFNEKAHFLTLQANRYIDSYADCFSCIKNHGDISFFIKRMESARTDYAAALSVVRNACVSLPDSTIKTQIWKGIEALPSLERKYAESVIIIMRGLIKNLESTTGGSPNPHYNPAEDIVVMKRALEAFDRQINEIETLSKHIL